MTTTPLKPFSLMRQVENLALYGFLIALSAFMILPFVWMVSTSFKSPDEVFARPLTLIPADATWNAYTTLIQDKNILGALGNTAIIASVSTVVSLFFCSLGGYGFAKFKFPGREVMFAFLLGTMIIPFTVIIVPLYLIMRDLKWIDTFWPLIIPGAANAFGIFFMRQYVSGISSELLDAARIDGCGEFGIYTRVVVPIVLPGLTSLGLIFFMGSWNAYLWPLLILKSPSNFTLPLVIWFMNTPVGMKTTYHLQMAASVISILPLLVIFLIFQRRFIDGITAGAVKG
jgi:ABC-type glycerol-3-phosphate transport system permease component